MKELDEQIEDKEKELKELQIKKRKKLFESYIKSLESISDEEKIKWFDNRWKSAYRELMKKVNVGKEYYDDDNRLWA